MRILIACRAFDNIAGGVERQAIALLNALVARGHDASLLTWDQDDAQAFYDIDPAVEWCKIGMKNHLEKAGWGLRLKRLKMVRQHVHNFKPDIILAFQHGTFFSMRLFTAGQGVPIIAAMRNAPSILDFTNMGKQRTFIFQTLRLADRMTVQFESYRQGFPKFLRQKITAISNAIEPAEAYAKPDQKHDGSFRVLAVGRLSFQKNFDLLIEAFARISDDCPDWKLFIAGEGEQRKALQDIIDQHDLHARIEMPGAIENINEIYVQSHLFCLPSLWEGFPNALSEALAHGLPSIGFKNCDGVNALIKDQKNGLLADNAKTRDKEIESLAQSLKTLMDDHARRKEMGQAAVKTMEPYAPEQVFDQWEDLFKEMIHQ